RTVVSTWKGSSWKFQLPIADCRFGAIGNRQSAIGNGLMLAIIYDPCQFRPQILARNNAVNETVLKQELAGLKPFGQFKADRVPDRPLAGKADEGARFRQGNVSLEGEAGGHAAHGGVGQDGKIETAGPVITPQGGRYLSHLHEGQDALLHAGAAAGA